VTVFVVGALVFNVPATYLWRDAGGGNSGATFFLVTAMLGVLLVHDRTRPAEAAALVAAAGGAALLLLGDAHGVAVLAGLAFGVGAAVVPGLRSAVAVRPASTT